MVFKVGASVPQSFAWRVPWFFWLEPATSSLLPGWFLGFFRLEPATSNLLPVWFLGSSGWSQQPLAFYLDGSLVLKVGASRHQPVRAGNPGHRVDGHPCLHLGTIFSLTTCLRLGRNLSLENLSSVNASVDCRDTSKCGTICGAGPILLSRS